jgi:AcrR family transcriptional regulator
VNERRVDDRREPRPRKPRSDGQRSREAILREAAQLVTVEGIEGLSISRLAEAVGMSKSGLFAHFGSKEELQLATIETATALFDEQVVAPALTAPTGVERLRQLAENFLVHVEQRVYPGGCFFASVAAEMDTQPGPVRDLVLRVAEEWFRHVAKAVRDAQAEGAIVSSEDADQLAFEIDAYLLFANAQFVLRQQPLPMLRARRAIERRLEAAAPARPTAAARTPRARRAARTP